MTFSYEKIVASVLLPQYIDWAYKTDKRGLEIGKPLNQKELALAAEIGINNPENVRIVYVDEVPYPYENVALKFFGEAVGLIGEGIIITHKFLAILFMLEKILCSLDLNLPMSWCMFCK